MVSVIVPCYNVSKYVKRCIDSIMHQSYSSIEVIAINDCSTDDTLSMLQSIKEEYQTFAGEDEKYIKLIDLTCNVGLGTVRDIGVSHANGQYIMFVDSDDWLSYGCISSCVSLMEKYQADLVEFGYERKSKFENQRISEDLVFTICESSIEIEKKSDHIVCNKMLRTDIIKKNNIQFKYRTFEDTLFTRKYALCCSRAIFVDNIFYIIIYFYVCTYYVTICNIYSITLLYYYSFTIFFFFTYKYY